MLEGVLRCISLEPEVLQTGGGGAGECRWDGADCSQMRWMDDDPALNLLIISVSGQDVWTKTK